VKTMGIKNKVKHVRKWALTLPVTLCSPSSLKVFVGFRVVFPKLFDDILARVTVVNDVPFCTRDDVCDTVSQVDYGTGECPVCGAVGCPGCGKGKHSLNSDVEIQRLTVSGVLVLNYIQKNYIARVMILVH